MGKKDWALELGERTVDPADADEVLKDKISERKRKQLERQDELDEAAHRAKMAELEKRTKTSEVAVDKVEKEQPEQPFKVTGGINLGMIDYQKQLETAQEEQKRMRHDAEEQAQTQGHVNQQLRDELHKKELDILSIGLQAQIQALGQQIGTKKNFMEEYNEALTTAKTLGLYNPQAGTNASEMIEIKKIEFENTLALRKLAREEKRADREALRYEKQVDREFTLQLRKYDDDREFKKEELERAKKRDEMLASTPEVLGRVIARGLVEGGGGEGSIEEAGPITRRGKGPGIVAGVGESGEAECPQCQQPMAIGPTARVAVCASCGAKYPIKRVRQEVAPVEEE